MNTRPDPRFPKLLALLVALAGVTLLAVSCNSSSPTEPDSVASVPEASSSASSDSNSSNDPGSSGTNGQPGSLTINLTDLPTDEICQLWVYFAELRIKPDGGPPEFVLPGFFGQAWDLLTLRNGAEEEMGEFDIEHR